MFTIRSFAVALQICFAASITFSAIIKAEEDAQMKKDDIKSMTGDIICVLPMDKDGNVKAVIASGDCSGYAPHVHVFREAGTSNVFSIAATPEKLHELEISPNKKGVTLAGRVAGSTRGWILYVQ